MLLFTYLSLYIKIEKTETFKAKLYNDILEINRVINVSDNAVLYVYKNGREEMYKLNAKSIVQNNHSTKVYLDESRIKKLKLVNSAVQVEIVVGKQSLLKKIFVNAGKG